MKKEKRYCLERRIQVNKKQKMEVWHKTNLSSDNVDIFIKNFLVRGYRVFDTVENKVVVQHISNKPAM